MSRSVAPLFRPFALSKLSLANRVVMAPMTRQMSPGGIPGPEVAAYYRRRDGSLVAALQLRHGVFQG